VTESPYADAGAMTETALQDSAQRITILRQCCLERKAKAAWLPWLTAESLQQSKNIPSWQIRCGLRARDRLAGVLFEVDDLELLMGRLAPLPQQQADLKHKSMWLIMPPLYRPVKIPIFTGI